VTAASPEGTVRTASLLVVDDDPAIRKILRDRFRALGHAVSVAEDGEAALSAFDRGGADLVLLDLQLPGLDGFGVLEALAGRPDPPRIVVLTAHGSIEAAIRAIRAGAADFVTKPFDATHLEHVVATVLERSAMRTRIATLEGEISERHRLVRARSPAMREVEETALRVAPTDTTVLLRGESGTGKEVVARALHKASKRREGPFLAINCAALASDLLESEVFGHEKGAFTGAIRTKPGKVELAAGGTLFLDEVTELPLALQPKLLRVLQEREFERVGGTRTLRADVRLIAATNRDLTSAIAEGRFRQDLYYRLNVVTLKIPPLRDRADDILPLAEHFLRRLALESGRPEIRFSPEARGALSRYGWPGNVRELSNVVERAVVLSTSDMIRAEDLPEELLQEAELPRAADEPRTFHAAVAEAKRSIIRDALRRTDGHQTRAAELLGLTQPYLARLVKSLGLRDDR
jgi:DNA-binding NtrC family response regulator